MLASLGQEGIDRRVVILSGPRFELLPVDRNFHRIDIQVFHGGPDFRKHGRPTAGVMHLCAQQQVRCIVDEQGVAPIFLHHAGNRALLYLGVERTDDTCGHQSGQNSRSHFHFHCSALLNLRRVETALLASDWHTAGEKDGSCFSLESLDSIVVLIRTGIHLRQSAGSDCVILLSRHKLLKCFRRKPGKISTGGDL